MRTRIAKEGPKQSTLSDYCAVVLALADLCKREQKDGAPNKALHSWYLYRQAFYGFHDYLKLANRDLASQRANKRFGELLPGRDIRDLVWSDQPSFDPKRREFHCEHVYSGNMFRNHVDQIINTSERVEKLANIVQENFRIAWILKEEDRKLKRSDRGDTLQSALERYSKVGIKFSSDVRTP